MASERALAFLLALSACSADDPLDPGEGAGCPTGHALHPSGEGCVPVGIQGCAEIFIGDDGLCRPSLEHCPAGSIPLFHEGCMPVGIASCAPEFVEADGICHPTKDKCPAGSFAVPSVGCVPIDGEGCGSGTWGDIADAPGTIWVDPSYAGADGDGSMLMPVTTIAAAQALLPLGGRIALAAGDYDEPVSADVALEIVGRCPSLVTIRGTQMTQFLASPVVVFSNGAELTLRALRLTGGIGVAALGGRTELDGVHIDGATPTGATAAQGNLVLHRTLISGTTSGATSRAIGIEQLGNLVVEQSALVENRGVALFASGVGTLAVLEDSVIEKTLSQLNDATYGNGMNVTNGASVQVMGSALRENRDLALAADGAGAELIVSQSIVEKTLPLESDMSYGRAVHVQEGARASVDASALLENRDTAVFASHASTAQVSRSLLAHTQPRAADLTRGRGIEIQTSSTLRLDQSVLVGNHEGALIVAALEPEPAPSAVVNECLIEGTLFRESDGAYGVGIGGTGQAGLVVTSSMLRQNRTAGVMIALSTTLEIASSLIDEVLPGKFHQYEGTPDGQVIVNTFDGVGDGIVVAFGAQASVTDTAVLRGHRAGIAFASSSGVLRGVRSTESPIGLVLQGEPSPDWQHESNLFEGSQTAIVQNGTLPVPEPPPLPR